MLVWPKKHHGQRVGCCLRDHVVIDFQLLQTLTGELFCVVKRCCAASIQVKLSAQVVHNRSQTEHTGDEAGDDECLVRPIIPVLIRILINNVL